MEYNTLTISEGIAVGKVVNVINDICINREFSTIDNEINLFNLAISDVIKDLNQLNNTQNTDEEFINVHLMILKDPTLAKEVLGLIENHTYSASKAFCTVIDDYIRKFEKACNTYLMERALDLKDIKNRVLTKMCTTYSKKEYDEQIILMCDELYPSLLMEYKDNLVGVISKVGGETSHSAILCKSREIPYVVLNDNEIESNQLAIIDTRKEKVIVNPSLEEYNSYLSIQNIVKQETPIGDFSKYKIKISANVSSNAEIEKVLKYNLHSIGLYRTEFIFMNLNRPMSVLEQFEVYEEALDSLQGQSVTFRTFDIGDDKQLSYVNCYKKGIDNYRNNKELFENQIIALLKANKYSNIKIMFPMIETYDEFKYLRDWVYKIKVRENNKNFIKIGMMLETKKALENISDFKDIDFMSIGTNDLTSELYDIKRDEVLNYHSFIEDLIGKIEKVSKHCKMYNIELSICGELASCSDVVGKLYDANIKHYSVSAPNAKAVEYALKKHLEDKR